MKRLYNIDLLKFLCAVLVIFLHVRTPYQAYILPLTRCAVPCFLIVSGYFIFDADRQKFQLNLKKNVGKIFRIFVWSTLLFAFVKLLLAFKNHDYGFLNLNALFKFIVLNENPFGFHLWYIGAYLYTLLIVLFLERHDLVKWLYWTFPVLLLADLCFGKYSLAIWHKEIPFIYVRNFLCVGIPYFTIGMLIRKYHDTLVGIRHLSILTLGGVFLFSLTSLVENKQLIALSLNAARDHYISSTLLAVSLVLFFLFTKQVGGNSLSTLGEKDSLYIYVFHPLFFMFFSTINKYLPDLWKETYLYLSPIIILTATILFDKTLRILHIIK